MIPFNSPAAFLSGRHAWRFWLPLLLVAARTGLAAGIPVQAGHATMSQGVAQVVMGIISYTRWPSTPAVVHLCVMGDTAYAGDLLAQPPGPPGRPVDVRRIGAGAGAGLPDHCEALYLGALPPAERALVAQRISGLPVVSISENDPDCAIGSMFCLDVQPLHVGFRVNLDAIARSGVRIHPSVLQLARPRPSSP